MASQDLTPTVRSPAAEGKVSSAKRTKSRFGGLLSYKERAQSKKSQHAVESLTEAPPTYDADARYSRLQNELDELKTAFEAQTAEVGRLRSESERIQTEYDAFKDSVCGWIDPEDPIYYIDQEEFGGPPMTLWDVRHDMAALQEENSELVAENKELKTEVGRLERIRDLRNTHIGKLKVDVAFWMSKAAGKMSDATLLEFMRERKKKR